MPINMPVRSQLKPEQIEIIDLLPPRGISLIVGPPGTGKTVIGMWRAKQLANSAPVIFTCFNKVLKAHSETWVDQGFKKVEVQAVYEFARELCKSLLEKSWVREYRKGKLVLHPPWPLLPGSCSGRKEDNFNYAWADLYIQISEKIKELEDQDRDIPCLGHLIVDEGQDQDKDFYMCMSLLVSHGVFKSLTVLADENQRLTDTNSSIAEISESLSIGAKLAKCTLERRLLKMNHRNTREIAKLSKRFYVGADSGKPELPDRRGTKPKFFGYSTINQAASRVAVAAKSDKSRSILVICGGRGEPAQMQKLIEEELRDTRGVKVTRYENSNSEWGDPKLLECGDAGVISIVHPQSMKGLEADSCIVSNIDFLSTETATKTYDDMTMYVATSRARSDLQVFYKAPASNHAQRTYEKIQFDIDDESKDRFQ